jgi:glycosyltransferase involved in cell wall biosynthesis
VKEIVMDGVDGYYVNETDVESIASAIRFFISNKEQAKTMGAAGRLRVLKEFALDSFQERFVKMVDDALSST